MPRRIAVWEKSRAAEARWRTRPSNSRHRSRLAEVRTMLAKIYLDQKKPELARAEAEKAVKLAPNYAEAKQLLEHLRNSKAADKKPGGGAP